MMSCYIREVVMDGYCCEWLAQKAKGDSVNIEVDMMAKYAEKSLAGILGTDGSTASIPLLEKMVERIVAQSFGAKPPGV